jgi:hypothetical protein
VTESVMARVASLPTTPELKHHVGSAVGYVEMKNAPKGAHLRWSWEGGIPMIPENQAFKPVFKSGPRPVSAFISAQKRLSASVSPPAQTKPRH